MFSKKEKKTLIWISVIATAIVMLPTVFGFLYSTDAYVYTGLHILSPADYPVYYSYIEQVKQGHFAFIDLFTSEPQARVMINPFWLAVGLMAKILNLSAPIAFHVARVILIPIFIWVLYVAISKFIKREKERKWLTLLTLTSSGLGFWITPFLPKIPRKIGEYASPSDMWTAEANTFLALLHSPHFILSTTALLLTFIFLIKSIEEEKQTWAASTGLVMLVWFWFHPFNIVTVVAILFVFSALLITTKHPKRWTTIKNLSIAATIASPAVLYYSHLMQFDWLTAQRSYQNINLTSSLWLMLSGYGLLIPLAIIGWYEILKKIRKDKYNLWLLLLLAWLPAQWLIIYAPINFQRRLTHGLHLIMTFTAWFGIIKIYEKYKHKIHKNETTKNITLALVIATSMLLVLFSSFGNWITEFDSILKRPNYLYISKHENEAIQWVKNNSSAEDVYIADLNTHYTQTFIPGFTGKKVYAGHGVETAFFHCCKKRMVQWFYLSKSPEDVKQKFLNDNKITHVWFDVEYNKNLHTFDPSKLDEFNPVFKNPQVTIYAKRSQ